ncbi:MAG: YraN family protein [Propionibacteriaceae bacterium]|jgi:putative endonuclease|nr:YraN family protein [Propionibacteriaceae bacterium]
MDQRKTLGNTGEEFAANYLLQLGWTILERNWRCSRVGEIDIIAVEPSKRQGTLVFCEVKAKSGHGYGDPLEAITREKLQRLHRLACMWMATHPMGYDRVRIDAIGVSAIPGQDVKLNHAKAIRL